MRSLGLLSVAHAINHAQAVILPLIFLAIIDEFGVGVETIAFLAATAALLSGAVQLSYACADAVRLAAAPARDRRDPVRWRVRRPGAGHQLHHLRHPERRVADRRLTAARRRQRPARGTVPDRAARLRDQRPHRGGNVGTVVVAVIGVPLIAAVGWRGASIAFGLPAIAVAIAILLFVRERGTDRAAAVASGTLGAAFRRILGDHDLRWLYLTSALGGGGRGLGVVNLFALIYMTRVLGIDEATAGLMYGVLIVFSVPMPLIAGWLPTGSGGNRSSSASTSAARSASSSSSPPARRWSGCGSGSC